MKSFEIKYLQYIPLFASLFITDNYKATTHLLSS